MANIHIQRKHRLSTCELKSKIDAIMEDIKDEIEFQSEWENPQELSFKRKGAKGRIEFDDTNFDLQLNLGMMFRAFRGRIEKRIITVLDQHLAEE